MISFILGVNAARFKEKKLHNKGLVMINKILGLFMLIAAAVTVTLELITGEVGQFYPGVLMGLFGYAILIHGDLRELHNKIDTKNKH